MKKLQSKNCIVCHKEFQPKKSKSKCCSKHCAGQFAGKSRKYLQPKICLICHKEYMPRTVTTKLCSIECRKESTKLPRGKYISDLDRLNRHYIIDQESGCWLWTGALDSNGYSTFMFNNKISSGHRSAYILHKGEIQAGLDLDHLCRVPKCVNPDHLEPVTRYENQRRSALTTTGRAYCKNGHEFNTENTRINKLGHRICKTCHRNVNRRSAQKRRKQNKGNITCLAL